MRKMKHEKKWLRATHPGGPLKFKSVAISSGLIIFHSLTVSFLTNANTPYEISALAPVGPFINTVRSNVCCFNIQPIRGTVRRASQRKTDYEWLHVFLEFIIVRKKSFLWFSPNYILGKHIKDSFIFCTLVPKCSQLKIGFRIFVI